VDAQARRLLARDLDNVARLQGTFVLRSGATASEYFDKYRFEADPALLLRLAQAMLELVPGSADVLAGVELGGVPIATAMSLAGGMPIAFVRKQAKTYGTCQAVEGANVKGRKVAIIEDVISTGGAVIDAAAHLREAGAEVVAVVCAVWRGGEAMEIASLDIPVHAAFTRADLDAA
jgi:orotate phosphoribosyltransferase